jgi:electron transfer flavoprotein alpha subunit
VRILVVAEHDGGALRRASLACLSFAQSVAGTTSGEVSWIVLGHQVEEVAAEASIYAPVILADAAELAHPLAEPFARIIARVVADRKFDLVSAATSTFGKDILPRAAALARGAMASDVVRHQVIDGQLIYDCPQYAGAVTASLRLIGSPQFVTVRAASYSASQPLPGATFAIERLELDAAILASRARHEELRSKKNTRPDVTEAKVVVSGGRALKNSDDFERLVGGLADVLRGAVGSSRALVDAGITANELQVGQTGKVVAPQLYIALGISGAVQHLAGMKNSGTIVAINNDRDAPIFDVADFGVVGDIYHVVPELIEKLRHRAALNGDARK